MALTDNGAPQVDHASIINEALSKSGRTSPKVKPVSVNNNQLVSTALGSYSKNQKKAAELTRLKGKAQDQGFFDSVKDGLGTGLSWVGKALSVIDLPRSAVAATIRQGYGQLSDLIQGEDEYKVGQWWNDFVNHLGVGRMLEDSPLADSNIWVKRGIGFVGDVATDPLTYVSFGAVPVAKKIGTRGIEAGADALVREGAEQAAQGAARAAATEVGKTAGEAVIEQTAKQASRDPLREGNRVLNRMLSRDDVALRIEKSYEAGALSREAATKLQEDVFARGVGSIPREAQDALVSVNKLTGNVESAAVRSGMTWGFGRARVMVPGTEALAKRAGAAGGVVRRGLSKGVRWTPFIKHIPEKFESLPGLNRVFENFGRYGTEGFNPRGVWAMKYSETAARDVAHSASLGWASDLKNLHSKWAQGFSDAENIALRDAMEGLGASEPKIRAAANDLADWFENVRVVASEEAGQEIPRFYDYLPHRLSKAYREYLSAGGKGGSRTTLGLELKRSYRAGEKFLGIPLENGTIQELESIAKATFGQDYVQIFKSNPWEIAVGYINEAQGYVHRGAFGKNLVKLGLATEADMVDLSKRVLAQSRLRDTALRQANKAAQQKIRAEDLERELSQRASAGELSAEAAKYAKQGDVAQASADAANTNARGLETVAKTLQGEKQKLGRTVTSGMRDLSPRGPRGPKIPEPGGLSVARAERGVETAQGKLDELLARNADEVAAAEAAAAQVDNAVVDVGAQVDDIPANMADNDVYIAGTEMVREAQIVLASGNEKLMREFLIANGEFKRAVREGDPREMLAARIADQIDQLDALASGDTRGTAWIPNAPVDAAPAASTTPVRRFGPSPDAAAGTSGSADEWVTRVGIRGETPIAEEAQAIYNSFIIERQAGKRWKEVIQDVYQKGDEVWLPKYEKGSGLVGWEKGKITRSIKPGEEGVSVKRLSDGKAIRPHFSDIRPADAERASRLVNEKLGSAVDNGAEVAKIQGYLDTAKSNLAKAQSDLDSAEAKAAAESAAPSSAQPAPPQVDSAAIDDFASWSKEVKGSVGTAAKKTSRAIELDAAERAGTPIRHELLDESAASGRKIVKQIERHASAAAKSGKRLDGYIEVEGAKWYTNSFYAIAENGLPNKAKFTIPFKENGPQLGSILDSARENATEAVVRLEQFADNQGDVLIRAIGENGTEVVFNPEYLSVFNKGLEFRLSSPTSPAGFFKDGEIVGVLMPIRMGADQVSTKTAAERIAQFLNNKVLKLSAGRRTLSENPIPQSVRDLSSPSGAPTRAQQIAEMQARKAAPKFDEAARKAELERLRSIRDGHAAEVDGYQSELDSLKSQAKPETPKEVSPEVKVEAEAASRSKARESVASSQIKAAEPAAAEAAGRQPRNARQIERATARLEKAAAHLEKEQDRFNAANAARGEAEYAQATNEARLLRIERDLENISGSARATRVYQREQAQLAKDLFRQARGLDRDAAEVTRLQALHAAANAKYDSNMADAAEFWSRAERVITPKEIDIWQTVLEQNLKEFADGRWADPEVVDAIQSIQRVMKPETVGALLKSYDVMLARWKAYQLFTPGYHIRNFLGGQFNAALGGMRFRMNFRYMKAMAEMRANPEKGIDAITDAEFREAYREAVKHEIVVGNTEIRDLGDIYNGPNETDRGLAKDFLKSKKRKAFEQAKREGMFVETGAAGTKPGKNFDLTAMDNLLLEWNHRMAARVEHAIRVPQFVDHFIATGNLEESLNLVRKFQFDYSGATANSLSQVERKFMRRLFPFYTYTRFNFPLQIEMMWRQPGKYAVYNSAKRNLELGVEKEDVVPSFYGNLLAIHTPFTTRDDGPYFSRGEDGANIYLTPDLPFRDLAEVLNPSTAFGQLTPALKTPIELAAGKSIYTDIPFRSGNAGYTPLPQTWMPLVPFLASPLGGKLGLPKVIRAKDGTWLINDRDAYKIEQSLPVLGRLRRLAPSEPKFQKRAFTTYLSLIGGVSSYTNSSSSQWGELERQAKVIRDEIKMRDVVNTEY